MSIRNWMPSSDTELYQKVLVLFSVVQLVMGLALFALSTTAKPMLYLLAGFLVGALVAQLGYSGGTGLEWQRFGVSTPLILHTLLLFLTPSMALAALHGRRLDVNFLRATSVLNTLLAAALYVVPVVRERVERGVDNWYFSIFCLLCVAVTMVAAFLIPPVAFRSKKTPAAPAADEAADE